MKKLTFVVILVAGITAGNSFAQTSTTSASQAANVNLIVQTAMTLTNVRGLNFGTQVQGSAGITVSPVTSGTRAAYFTLDGAPPGQALTISWTASPNLTFNSTNINWSPSVAADSTTTQGSSAVVTSGGSTPANSSGNLYIWVGGSTGSVPSNAPAGTYQGTITLTVQY